MANIVLLRGAGSPSEIRPFKERWGLEAAVIAPTKLVRGVALHAGMRVVDVEGATGDYSSDYRAKARAALGCLQEGWEFVFVHFKGVDEACHDKDLAMKRAMLRKIDEAVGVLAAGLQEYSRDVLLCLTGDHSSPVLNG